MRWSRILPSSEARLDAVLRSWKGTPYMAGQRSRGVGADCKEFIVGVLDDCYGKHKPLRTATTALTPDAGMHDVRLGMGEVRAIMAQYPEAKVVRDGTIQPGDVLLVKSSNLAGAAGRPGHGMIAGAVPWTAWHAIPGVGVVQTSIAASKGVLRVYRPGKKGWWTS